MLSHEVYGPDTTAVLEGLRSGEPRLGQLGLHELSWLNAALTHLTLIYRKRGEGKPGDCPFCIFSFDSDPGHPYVQFLASHDAEQLLCEAVSAKSVPNIAAVLTSEREHLLRGLGFAAPGISPNYSQRIDVRGAADLGYAARLAFHVLKQVYGISDFGRGSFKFKSPGESLPSRDAPTRTLEGSGARPAMGEAVVIVGATPFKPAGA
jgi:hypothetical protein